MRLNRGWFFLTFFLSFAGMVIPCLAANSNEYFNAGLNLYNQKNYAQAIQYFNAALSLDPNLWQAYQGIAQSELALGKNAEALNACEKSLEIHPDNTFLVKMDNELKPKVNGPLVVPAAIPTIGGKSVAVGSEFAPSFWFKVSALYGYATDSDLNNAVDGWKHVAADYSAHQFDSAAGTMGFGFHLELGHPLDPENSFSLGLLDDFRPGFTGHATGTGWAISDIIQPTIYGLELSYSHFWPGRNYRYFAQAGVGYYYASVKINETASASAPTTFENLAGTIGNGDFGAFLGGGYELEFSNPWGLEISAFARTATISAITAPLNNSTYGLALDPRGLVRAVDTTLIGQNGYRFATIDLTGFDIHLGLVYYFFE